MNAIFANKTSNWLASHVNRNWDVDGFPSYQPYQCYDLANLFATEVVGSGRFTGLYAADIITQAGTKYRRINNTPSFVPQLGDIPVWNKNVGGGAGHVGIANGEGDTNWFVSLDQNWNRPTATFIRHDYNNLIGVLRPLASEEAASAPAVPTPSADNEGIVVGQGLRGRTDATLDSFSPWYFDDLERITLHARKRGQNVTTGPYSPSDWWYLAQGRDSTSAPKVWVSDAYIRTTKNPANVPDWVASTPVPTPTPPPVYVFAKDLDCVTELRPAAIGNFEASNFPQNPDTAVIHDFGTLGRDTIESLINTFTKPGTLVSAHFAVSKKRIIQLVSLKDRAFHAGSQGNNYVGIEVDPAMDPETIESVKLVLRQLRVKYGRTLKLIEHNTLMPTQCGDDVNLDNFDITEPPVILPNPPADPSVPIITDTLTHIQDFLFNEFKEYERR